MSKKHNNLNENYEFYRAKKADFLISHKGKFLLIHDKALIDVYDDQNTALTKALERFELGTFLIQHCISDEEETMQFYSRVSFASYATQRV